MRKMDENYMIDNGPTFSTDGKTLYHTDTVKRSIYAFDLDENGDLSNKRVFVQLTEEDGHPDGMTVDSENCIWLCHFGGSRVTRYSPEGEILQVIPMPVPNITSCTFGGQNWIPCTSRQPAFIWMRQAGEISTGWQFVLL